MALSPAAQTWRKQKRAHLLAARSAASAQDRAAWSAAIHATLIAALDLQAPCVLGLCWPYRQEFDARPLAAHLRARGVRSALPVVRGPGLPLAFHHWWPGVAMDKGVYDIPVPRDTEALLPDVLLVPPVGIDALGYRLGYGGGYFDRTLAAMARKPVCIAIGFEISRLPNIYPQVHDIAMDALVTEGGLRWVGDQGMESVSASRFGACLAVLRAQRAQ